MLENLKIEQENDDVIICSILVYPNLEIIQFSKSDSKHSKIIGHFQYFKKVHEDFKNFHNNYSFCVPLSVPEPTFLKFIATFAIGLKINKFYVERKTFFPN